MALIFISRQTAISIIVALEISVLIFIVHVIVNIQVRVLKISMLVSFIRSGHLDKQHLLSSGDTSYKLFFPAVEVLTVPYYFLIFFLEVNNLISNKCNIQHLFGILYSILKSHTYKCTYMNI